MIGRFSALNCVKIVNIDIAEFISSGIMTILSYMSDSGLRLFQSSKTMTFGMSVSGQ